MTSPATLSRRWYIRALWLGVFLIFARAAIEFPGVFRTFVGGDNDDMMRLMSVRGWLQGQGWFDMTQYRLLPPDGVSIHWSRFVDLGIAAVLVPLSWFTTMPAAESLMLVIWPSLLLCALLVLVAKGTERLLGGVAAIGAMASVLLWLPISRIAFKIGRIDHHNVQILMTTIMAFAMIWPGRPALRGVIAGLAAAFSLAVGLEMLPFVGVAGMIMAARSALGRAEADGRLAGFCVALLLASPVLFAGQTGRAEWFIPQCDALASPILALVLVASLACLASIGIARWLPHPAARLAVILGLTGLGLWLFAPLLLPCLGGPYAALPLELQEMMTTRISEAQPGLVFAGNRPLSYNSIVTPVFVVVAGGGACWLARRNDMDAQQREAVGQMLILGALGLLGSFSQIRAVTLGAAAVPFLTGFLLSELLRRRATLRTPAATALLIMGVLTTLLVDQLNRPLAKIIGTLGAGQRIESAVWDRGCRDPISLADLREVPKSRILTTGNLGAPMILLTEHDGLTAPYHRSAAALWNGTFPFESPENMVKALRATGAGYVALCRAATYVDHPFAIALQKGQAPDWLAAVPLKGDHFLLYQVQPAVLATVP